MCDDWCEFEYLVDVFPLYFDNVGLLIYFGSSNFEICIHFVGSADMLLNNLYSGIYKDVIKYYCLTSGCLFVRVSFFAYS